MQSDGEGGGTGAAAGPLPAFSAIHVFGLAAFALPLPLFLVLAGSPEFFFAHGLTNAQMVQFAAVAGLGLPAAISLIVALSNRLPRAVGRNLGWVLAFVLAVAAFLPNLNRMTFLPGPVCVALSFPAGALAVFAYWRIKGAREVFSLLAIGAAVYPAWFVWDLGVFEGGEPTQSTLAASPSDDERIPIVWLIFDEFGIEALLDETGEIDAARFPNFGKLVSESVWYRDATAVAEVTTEAIPAILTGRYPPERVKLSPTYLDYPQNAFTLLHAAGYPVFAHETLTRLCPPRINSAVPDQSSAWRPFWDDVTVLAGHVFFGQVLGDWLPSIDRRVAHFRKAALDIPVEGRQMQDLVDSAKFRTTMASSLLEGLSESPDGFHYLHLNIPHQEYQFLASGRAYLVGTQTIADRSFVGINGSDRPTDQDGARTTQEYPLALARQRYLLQVQYADYLLGLLMERMVDLGIFEESLLVVTADHGVSFRPGESDRVVVARGSKTVGDDAHTRDIVKVPLFIKPSGSTEGNRVSVHAESIDVLPTVLDLAGLPPRLLDGRSLVDAGPPRTNRYKLYSYFLEMLVEHETAADAPGYLEERSSWTVREENFRPKTRWDEYIGKEVETLDIRETPLRGVQVEIRNPSFFGEVNLDSEFLPAYVSGQLTGESGAEVPAAVAIALGGRVAAIAVLFSNQRGPAWVRAMIPEWLFVDGVNRVELIGIVESPDGTILARIEGGSVP